MQLREQLEKKPPINKKYLSPTNLSLRFTKGHSNQSNHHQVYKQVRSLLIIFPLLLQVAEEKHNIPTLNKDVGEPQPDLVKSDWMTHRQIGKYLAGHVLSPIP